MEKAKLKQLPLGISTLSTLIDQSMVYVDKTHDIYQMVSTGRYYFLSRPRRFGKSLLVSTLDALFSGKKELFKNLWIGKSDWSWQTHPVIRFDFSSIGHLTAQELQLGIIDQVHAIARMHTIDLSHDQTISGKFATLIQQLAQKNSVVILIDEYDKPILDHIDNLEEAKAQREVLKSLYSVIKGTDQYVRFVLLTGVSKFAKTSIFSGINNLKDISMDKRYATMLGYTQQEVRDYLGNYLERLAQKQKTTYEQAIQKLTTYYNGYQFATDAERVFNPYSVLSCCDESTYKNYWFETGTPTFLVQRIKTGEYALNTLYQPIMSAEELSAFEPENIKITALLYQTGYLTIKQYNQESEDYTLDFPNQEVTRSFNLLIASSFTQLTYRQAKTYAARIAQTFVAQNFTELQHVLQSLFNEMPYTVHVKREFDLQIIIFSIFKLTGLEVEPEVPTSIGRADLVVSFPKHVFVIELKFNKLAQEALEQIQDRRYYEKYENMGKKITLVGIAFDAHEKLVTVSSKEI